MEIGLVAEEELSDGKREDSAGEQEEEQEDGGGGIVEVVGALFLVEREKRREGACREHKKLRELRKHGELGAHDGDDYDGDGVMLSTENGFFNRGRAFYR